MPLSPRAIIAPSLPAFQGDQAVEAHSGKVPCVSRGDDRALVGLWGVEAEETGNSERGRVGKEEKRREEVVEQSAGPKAGRCFGLGSDLSVTGVRPKRNA